MNVEKKRNDLNLRRRNSTTLPTCANIWTFRNAKGTDPSQERRERSRSVCSSRDVPPGSYARQATRFTQAHQIRHHPMKGTTRASGYCYRTGTSTSAEKRRIQWKEGLCVDRWCKIPGTSTSTSTTAEKDISGSQNRTEQNMAMAMTRQHLT